MSLNYVSPNYFLTYRTPLLAGRDFRDADMDQPRRVIVNQTLARQYFPAAIRSGVTSGWRTSAIPTRSSASLATRSITTFGSRPLPSSTSSP